MSEKVMGIILAAGKGTRMQSDLPKVLHEVDGVPMVARGIEALRDAGVTDIVVVVGYRAELVKETLGPDFRYALQAEQLGTGHAVMSAREHIEGFDGKVVIVYGDAPLLNPVSIKRLIGATNPPDVHGSMLTIELKNPPAAGRIVRDDAGVFVEIVEVPDCSPEQLAIEEVNVGVYCFDGPALLEGLSELRSDNAQGEYYLTDVPVVLRQKGKHIDIIQTEDLLETLGVNDRHHLDFAEKVKHIKHAESLYPLIDAVVNMSRTNKGA